MEIMSCGAYSFNISKVVVGCAFCLLFSKIPGFRFSSPAVIQI